MLSVNLVNNFKLQSTNKNNYKKNNFSQNNIKPSFKGGIDFVLINKAKSLVPQDLELKQIFNFLKSLGVEELEIGENKTLARLLKKAIIEVKQRGWVIPTRIKCSEKFFKEDQEVFKYYINQSKKLNCPLDEVIILGLTKMNYFNNESPIIYLNSSFNWQKNYSKKILIKEHAILHEFGHWTTFVQNKRNPFFLMLLQKTGLKPEEKAGVNQLMGEYIAESPVHELLADTYARRVSDKDFDNKYPEIMKIYRRFKGPYSN